MSIEAIQGVICWGLGLVPGPLKTAITTTVGVIGSRLLGKKEETPAKEDKTPIPVAIERLAKTHAESEQARREEGQEYERKIEALTRRVDSATQRCRWCTLGGFAAGVLVGGVAMSTYLVRTYDQK